jgi:hypothetical protein
VLPEALRGQKLMSFRKAQSKRKKFGSKKFRIVDRILKQTRGSVGVREMARKTHLHPSSVSKYYESIGKQVSHFKAVKNEYKKASLTPVALTLLGLKRNQIKNLTGTKSERLKSHLVNLFFSRSGDDLFFDHARVKMLQQKMGDLFGMSEHVELIGFDYPADCRHDEKLLFSMFETVAGYIHDSNSYKNTISQVLGRQATIRDGFLITKGHKKKQVKLFLKHSNFRPAIYPNERPSF